MKRLSKRIISSVLTGTMLLSLLGGSALAVEPEGGPEEEVRSGQPVMSDVVSSTHRSAAHTRQNGAANREGACSEEAVMPAIVACEVSSKGAQGPALSRSSRLLPAAAPRRSSGAPPEGGKAAGSGERGKGAEPPQGLVGGTGRTAPPCGTGGAKGKRTARRQQRFAWP